MDNNHLFLENLSSTKLIIFFSGTGKRDGIFDFYQTGVTLSKKYNILLLNNGQNRWYLDGIPSLGNSFSDTLNAIKQLAKEYNITDIYCIGSSMGGFGALYYGTALQAQNILAFGCDTKLRLKGSRSLKSMHYTAPKDHFDITPMIKNYSRRITVIFGEMDVMDYYFATRLAKLSLVDLFIVSGVPHNPARHIKAYSDLNSYIDAFIQNGTPPPTIGQKKYVNHKEGELLYKIYIKFLNNEYENVISDISSYKQLKYTNTADYFLGISYFRLKQYTTALEYFLSLSGNVPWFTTSRRYQAICLRRLNKIDESLDLLKYSICLNDRDHAACCEMGVTYFTKGKDYYPMAKIWIQKAISLSPKNQRYQSILKKWNELIS